MLSRTYCAQTGRFDFRDWDDATVIHDRASGDTHLISSLAAEMLRALEQAACVSELLEQLAPLVDPATLTELPNAVDNDLRMLLRLGLIEADAA